MMNDLKELVDISDTISIEEPPILSEKDAIDLLETCLYIMLEYIEHEPTAITEPDFEDVFKENIHELVYSQLEYEYDVSMNPLLEQDIEMIIDEAWEIFFISIMPCRSYPSSIILFKPNVEWIEKHLEYLRSIPQPIQRTDEWYKLRHDLITASNAYKCFETQSMQNQIIFEKCQPLKVFEED